MDLYACETYCCRRKSCIWKLIFVSSVCLKVIHTLYYLKKKIIIIWKSTLFFNFIEVLYFLLSLPLNTIYSHFVTAYQTRRSKENGWWESVRQRQNGLRKSHRWVNRQNNTQYRRTKTTTTSRPGGLYRFRADRKAYHLV